MNIHLLSLILIAVPAAGANLNRLFTTPIINLNGIIPINLIPSQSFREVYDDDQGYDDGDFPEMDLSPLCLLSLGIISDNEELFRLPDPTAVASDDAIGYALDFATDEDAVDAFRNTCSRIGGQNMEIDIDFADTCNAPDFLNFPQCVGALCNQNDLDEIGSLFAGIIQSMSGDCAITTTAESIDGVGDVSGVDAPEVCVYDMAEMMFNEDVYKYFDEIETYGPWEFTVDPLEFTGEPEALKVLEMFMDSCESAAGRIVPMSLKSSGGNGCDLDNFSSLPLCVTKSCNNEEVKTVLKFLVEYIYTLEGNGSCDGVLVDLNILTDTGTKGSKSKKAIKSSKGNKSNKATKKNKGNKSDKAAKSIKGDKSNKATKKTKGKKSNKATKKNKGGK